MHAFDSLARHPPSPLIRPLPWLALCNFPIFNSSEISFWIIVIWSKLNKNEQKKKCRVKFFHHPSRSRESQEGWRQDKIIQLSPATFSRCLFSHVNLLFTRLLMFTHFSLQRRNGAPNTLKDHSESCLKLKNYHLTLIVLRLTTLSLWYSLRRTRLWSMMNEIVMNYEVAEREKSSDKDSISLLRWLLSTRDKMLEFIHLSSPGGERGVNTENLLESSWRKFSFEQRGWYNEAGGECTSKEKEMLRKKKAERNESWES